MYVGFHHARLEHLTDLWNSCLPDCYRITSEVFRANTTESNLLDWGASVLNIDDDARPLGYVVVKKSSASLFHGADPDMAHISAVVCPEPEMGVDLLSFVKKNLANRGVYKAVFGQDVRHFFAGCPSDFSSLKDLLTIEGFEFGSEYWDVSRDLSDYEAPEDVKLDRKGIRIGPLSPEDVPALEVLLKAEFSPRWRYDTMSKVKTEGSPESVFGLWVGHDLKGFAVTQWPGQKLALGGAVFAPNAATDWCSVGPIGVAKDSRGQGLGDALLASSVLSLKQKGQRHCVIDWTVLKDWYGKHGFEVCRTYSPCTLRLEEPS